MTNITQLKKDLEVVRRALKRDAEGYDEDGFDSEGFDRYGRSRELIERSRFEHQKAFESLTPDQQDLVMKAGKIHLKYEEKAIEWESQPETVKQQSPFYEEYKAHSDITKHSFLFSVWATEEEDKVSLEAATIMIRARNKLFPRNGGIH